jgi:hypothetical protein
LAPFTWILLVPIGRILPRVIRGKVNGGAAS